MGVDAVDAEKLIEMKQATIQGKVKEARLEPFNRRGESARDSAPYFIHLVLEDVRINGKAFKPLVIVSKDGKKE